MTRKKLAILLTVLMLNSSTALASVKSYEVYNNNAKHRVSYNVSSLIKGFLDHKQGNISILYNQFNEDLKQGKYIAFKDNNDKYVNYEDIIKEFLNCKQHGKDFNLDEFLKNAKSFDIEGKYGKVNDGKIDTIPTVTPSTPTTTGEIKYSKADIFKIMQDLTPTKLYAEDDNIIMQQRKQEMGCDRFMHGLKAGFYTVGDAIKLKDNYKDYLAKKKDPKYKQLFDLNSFEHFANLSVNFKELANNQVHAGTDEIVFYGEKNKYDANTLSKFFDKNINFVEKTITVNNGKKVSVNEIQTYVYECPWLSIAMWRPDIEEDMLKEINSLRKSRGMQPLEYSIDLHAMARYCVRQNNFDETYGNDTVGNGRGSGLTSGWLSKGVGSLENYNHLNDSDIHEYHSKHRKEYRERNVSGKLITLMDKDCGKIFGYKKDVNYITHADYSGLNAKGLVKELNERTNETYWRITGQETKQQYDGIPKLSENILNPDVRYIGIGSIWNAPASAVDGNGNTGYVIFTSK